MTTKMTNVVSQIYLQSEKKNKNLGDIKCVEAKRVFCIKHEKKKTDKNWKVVILSAQLLNLYQKGGWGWVAWHARH